MHVVMARLKPSRERKRWASMARRMRSATLSAPPESVPRSSTTYSSPPQRQTTSLSRTQSLMTRDTSTSSFEPTTWPWVSLMLLK